MSAAFLVVLPSNLGGSHRFDVLQNRLSTLFDAPSRSLSAEGVLIATVGAPLVGPVDTAHLGDNWGVGHCRALASPIGHTHIKSVVSPWTLSQCLRHFVEVGPKALDAVVGEYGFVLWDSTQKALHLLRDPLGIGRLFVQHGPWGIAVSSEASVLADSEMLSSDYVAAYLTGTPIPPGVSPWDDVKAVLPGAHERFWGQRYSRCSLFDVWSVQERASMGCDEAVGGFRSLLTSAVDGWLSGSEQVWSQLSGGLDSSSIVVIGTRDSAEKKLVGSYTIVDEFGRGESAHYARDVVNATGVPNEVIDASFPWATDLAFPPRTDAPRLQYPFWARDRVARSVVRRSGCTLLLGGEGADQYLGGVAPLVDGLRSRNPLRAVSRALADTAQMQRSLSHLFAPTEGPTSRREPPPWLRIDRPPNNPHAHLQRFSVRGTRARRALENVSHVLESPPFGDRVDRGYPFLYWPLVSFCLSLNRATASEVLHGKRLLRQAMVGGLPDSVRLRRSKGGATSRYYLAIARERRLMNAILADPIIAQAGWVRVNGLREEVRRAQAGIRGSTLHLLAALSLETWMLVRTGRWPQIQEKVTVKRKRRDAEQSRAPA